MKIVSNFMNDQFINRVYIGFNKKPYLILKNGLEFEGKIKTIKIKNILYYFTNTNLWFDNSGMPINKPDSIDTKEEIKKLNEEIKKEEENKKFEELKKKIINGK